MADEKKDKEAAEKASEKAEKSKSAAKEKKEPAKKAAKKESASKAGKADKAATKKEGGKEDSGKKEGAKEPAAKEAPKKERKRRAPEPAPAPLVVRASSRFVRVAPRKARLVANQVRGLHIDRARELLQFSPRGAARDIAKVIDSAAANAENNHDLVADEMRVSEITVDEGPVLRRYRPRALGRATPINKRTSHIAVALSPEEE